MQILFPPNNSRQLTIARFSSFLCKLSLPHWARKASTIGIALLICAMAVSSKTCRSSPIDTLGGAVSLDGFVTQVAGDAWSIGAILVRLGGGARCSRYDQQFAANRESDEKVRYTPIPCAAIAPKIGDYVHVSGAWSGTGEIVATNLQINDPWRIDGVVDGHRKWVTRVMKLPSLPTLRYFSVWSGESGRGKLQGGSFLEESPVL